MFYSAEILSATVWTRYCCNKCNECQLMFGSFSMGRIPNALGVSIPMKATFFMTYIMIDGWTSNAAEIFRLLPLLIYHLQNSRVQTDKERVKVIPATPPQYNIVLSRVSLYFLIGLVYAIISPLILPFLCVYFALGYIVYRNQV